MRNRLLDRCTVRAANGKSMKNLKMNKNEWINTPRYLKTKYLRTVQGKNRPKDQNKSNLMGKITRN